jgi:hypothetical protein
MLQKLEERGEKVKKKVCKILAISWKNPGNQRFTKKIFFQLFSDFRFSTINLLDKITSETS